jgi:hypothetical protein
MVEKGDQGLDETPPSSFEEVPLGPPRPRTRGAVAEEGIAIGDDSDDDPSEDEEERSQDTVDTQVVTDLNVVGQGDYNDTRCLIGLLLLRSRAINFTVGIPGNHVPGRNTASYNQSLGSVDRQASTSNCRIRQAGLTTP